MNDALPKKLYTAYCEGVGGVAFNGNKLPTADEFFTDPSKEKQAKAWRKAAQETGDLFLECARNLGNPAYGHSFATTEAIDELRKKALDFLEIPE